MVRQINEHLVLFIDYIRNLDVYTLVHFAGENKVYVYILLVKAECTKSFCFEIPLHCLLYTLSILLDFFIAPLLESITIHAINFYRIENDF